MPNMYEKFLEYYERNRDKNWKEWLAFDQMFDKPGKQGLVGLLKIKNHSENQEYIPKCVFKMSQHIDYLINHEAIVMSGLNQISSFCPHFCKMIGQIKCETEPKCRKKGDPFKIRCKYPVETEVLLCEYIEDSLKFYNYIKDRNTDESVLYSIVKQVLLGVMIAQKKKRFTHYDLHSDNVMVRRCDKDIVNLYIIDEDNQFCIPTMGYNPIIIDYGFSYISDMEDNPMWASLAHTDVGFMSNLFDWVADPKLFLVSVSLEIKNKRNSKQSKIFRRIVKNIFYPLNIDWESGWDEDQERGATEFITQIFEEHNGESEIFTQYENYCMDILQTMILLPLENQNYDDVSKKFSAWMKEWIKIEREISNPFYNLYILKGIVDSVIEVRSAYIQNSTRQSAVNKFRRLVYERLSKVSKFCNPKNVNFEIMLCSLICLTKCMEGILYDVVGARMIDKNEEYSQLPVDNIEQIFAIIDTNIEDKYTYNERTKIQVIDNINNKKSFFYLDDKDKIDEINDMESLNRGGYIYDIYKSKIFS
jgi:hypothetical protein